jgi:predicted glycosyltransferase
MISPRVEGRAANLAGTGILAGSPGDKKIWIDLDNSPHVPFFVPIIEDLGRRGYSVLVTARDCFQVCDLADLLGLQYKRIGRHHGKVRILKLAGLCVRALQLAPTVLKEKPVLALSHGSRAQLLLSGVLRLPSIVIMDYEFVGGLMSLRPSWIMVPETIPDAAVKIDNGRILKYPGIKEDVYASRFRHDASLKSELGLRESQIVVTVRPPANEAHYHCHESDVLFHAVIESLSHHRDTKVILLPRNQRQEVSARKTWPGLFAAGKITVPAHAVDGLNLIWHSDLVISGGGTMNREAAALGVPVYSIFRGKIGAVDRYLANAGRLVLVESVDDVRTKIALVRRHRSGASGIGNSGALKKIVDNIVAAVELTCPVPEYSVQ